MGSSNCYDDVTFMNSGVTNSDGSESYMFGNYSERDVEVVSIIVTDGMDFHHW